jgi:hypothetical protein
MTQCIFLWSSFRGVSGYIIKNKEKSRHPYPPINELSSRVKQSDSIYILCNNINGLGGVETGKRSKVKSEMHQNCHIGASALSLWWRLGGHDTRI